MSDKQECGYGQTNSYIEEKWECLQLQYCHNSHILRFAELGSVTMHGN